jgi:SAM-dependent methyltransferase
MSDDTFDAGWLALREKADHRSRDSELAAILDEEGEYLGWSRVLDLGSGTGSNLRYLAAKLRWAGAWTLLDHDAELLARAGSTEPDITVARVQGDLADEGLAEIERTDLVTASALLDLVSERWLRSAVAHCAAESCGALFALTYDGRIEWSGDDPEDDLIHSALNAHQLREKGLGAALGPNAAFLARDLFERAGYRTWLRPTPWVLSGADDILLATALMKGWVEASVEMRPADEGVIRAWAERRGKEVSRGRFRVEVGHQDLLALPADGGGGS